MKLKRVEVTWRAGIFIFTSESYLRVQGIHLPVQPPKLKLQVQPLLQKWHRDHQGTQVGRLAGDSETMGVHPKGGPELKGFFPLPRVSGPVCLESNSSQKSVSWDWSSAGFRFEEGDGMAHWGQLGSKFVSENGWLDVSDCPDPDTSYGNTRPS